MTAPHSLAHLGRDKETDQARRIRALEQAVAALTTARTLESASIGKGGIRSSNFNGDMTATTDADDKGTAGWAATGLGVLIANQFLLQDNSIGNSKLTSPIVPAAAQDAASGYAVPQGTGDTGGGVNRASVSLTVPDGFTKAFVIAATMDYGFNTTSSADYLTSYVQIGINQGTYIFASSGTAPAGMGAAATAIAMRMISGLTPGQSFTTTSRPFSYYGAWPANSSNSTALSVGCLFLR